MSYLSTNGKLNATFLKPVLSGLVAYLGTNIVMGETDGSQVSVGGYVMEVATFNAMVSAGSCLSLNTVSTWLLPMILSQNTLVTSNLILQPVVAGGIGVIMSSVFRSDFVDAIGYGPIFALHAGSEAISTYSMPLIQSYLP